MSRSTEFRQCVDSAQLVSQDAVAKVAGGSSDQGACLMDLVDQKHQFSELGEAEVEVLVTSVPANSPQAWGTWQSRVMVQDHPSGMQPWPTFYKLPKTDPDHTGMGEMNIFYYQNYLPACFKSS